MKELIFKVLSIFGLKYLSLWVLKIIKLFYVTKIKYKFNSYVKSQNKNYKSIPIIIISFNQLFYLKQLIDFLKINNYTNLIIIDNNSTYKPLLEYFDIIGSTTTIHRLKENFGHLVFWKNKEIYNKYSKGYYVVTDPDIIPIEECPREFLLHFKNLLEHNHRLTKVGFSLKLDDIPETNPKKIKILNWESRFWNTQNKDGNYPTAIDTTFALYKPNYLYNKRNFYAAIRTKKPYQARHGGWYLDAENLTDEQKYYFTNCNESSSWKINDKGVLFTKDYD